MDIQTIQKFFGRKVFLILKSGFKYKILLTQDNLKDRVLSFYGIHGEPVSVDIDEISLITISYDSRGERWK